MVEALPTLQKQGSVTSVTSCHQYESAVFPGVKVRDAWTHFKNLDFVKLLPSKVAKVEGKVAVGETVTFHFTDKSEWTVRVVELSELHHFVSWELLAANPSLHVTSAVNTLRLHRITECNSTFLSWETEFSNDADLQVIQDNKYKKLEYFAEIRKNLAGCCDKSACTKG